MGNGLVKYNGELYMVTRINAACNGTLKTYKKYKWKYKK